MQGKYILHRRPSRFNRQNYSLAVLRCGAFIFLLTTLAITVILALLMEYEAAATIFVFSVGITGFIFNTILSRQLHLNEVTDSTLGLLRERWDALRNDEDLLRLFCHKRERKLNSKDRLKLRLYLSTFIDLYILIIRYVRYGYFDRDTEIELAVVFENMTKSLFQYPYMVDVWRTTDKYGKGCLRDEYSGTTLYVVDNIVSEIEGQTA